MTTKDKKGFSLIEILIVITIIGILMAIMLPVYKGIAMKGRAVKCQANLKNLYMASILKVKGNGQLPYAFSYVKKEKREFVPGYEYGGVKGWVDWSVNEWAGGLSWDETWLKVKDNLGLGVTLWSGEGGRYSVTNGSIWSYTGKSLACYSCPEFKVLHLKTDPPGTKEIYRTYVFNRKISGANLSSMKRLSSTIMFGEGAVNVLTVSAGNETGYNGDNENQWDGCFSPERNNEVLGHYHKNGTSFIVFCDGHIEKLRKTGANPDTGALIPAEQKVLAELCQGVFLDRKDF